MSYTVYLVVSHNSTDEQVVLMGTFKVIFTIESNQLTVVVLTVHGYSANWNC